MNNTPGHCPSTGWTRVRLGLTAVGVLVGVGWLIAPGLTTAAKPHKRARSDIKTLLDEEGTYRRVLWVTRWDYRAAKDVERICYNAASARFTDVLFQVRGAGTVFYQSAKEPWAWELTGKDASSTGRDPGWDPLATAVREAGRYGLRVHAYMNVLPGWAKNKIAPPSTGQLYSVHRSWFMVDYKGRRMRPGNWYAFLDPGLPQVQRHLAELFAEVARKYKVAGVHLDYIRYPMEKGDFSYHPEVLQAFESVVGGKVRQHSGQWAQHRRDQVTDLVRTIAKAVRGERPGIEVSAAVIADRDKGRNQSYQEALRWVREGVVDAIAPMAYTGETKKFEEYCENYREDGIREKVWMGVWADPKKNQRVTDQIRRAAGKGFGAVAIFAYSNLFHNHKPTSRAKAVYREFVGKSG